MYADMHVLLMLQLYCYDICYYSNYNDVYHETYYGIHLINGILKGWQRNVLNPSCMMCMCKENIILDPSVVSVPSIGERVCRHSKFLRPSEDRCSPLKEAVRTALQRRRMKRCRIKELCMESIRLLIVLKSIIPS